MNRNIEVITPELWAVNSQWVRAGYIRELSPVDGVDWNSNTNASLTNNGILILKKESEFYPILKKFMPKIMALPDSELQARWENMKDKPKTDGYTRMYYDALRWELKRRRIKRDYLESVPRLTLKDRIKEFLRKVGEKYGYFKFNH
ncbi:MAG: hypothetical protein LUD69_04360 [Oscillospiraceae bacterium]|nr:hypothetical protein [Oscillospiraceae bacterium]